MSLMFVRSFTAYRLGHCVYGPTQDMIIRLTLESLTPVLLKKILESPDGGDIAWALQHLRAFSPLSPGLQTAVAGLIQNEDFSLASTAIATFTPTDLASAGLPPTLLERMPGLKSMHKKQLFDTLKNDPALDERVKMTLTRNQTYAEGALM